MGDTMIQPENPDNPTILLRRIHRWRMAFFGLIILIAGLTTGTAVTLLVFQYAGQEPPGRDERPTAAIMDRIVPRLHLSRDQVEKVGPILRKYLQRLEEIREQGRTQIAKELQAMDDQMATVLRQDQQRLWRDLMQGLPGQFQRGPGRFGSGPQGRFGRRDGQGHLRRFSERPAPSPNDPPLPN